MRGNWGWWRLGSLPLNATGEGSSTCVEDQSSLINSVHLSLIVTNTMLTTVHTLKPSSSTHSLQIYCTGFTDPRSHTSCAEKRDPTNINILLFLLLFFPKFDTVFHSTNTQINLFCIFINQQHSNLFYPNFYQTN